MKNLNTFTIVKIAFGTFLLSALAYAFIVGDFSHFSATFLG